MKFFNHTGQKNAILPEHLMIIDVQNFFINNNTKHIPQLIQRVQKYYKKVYHIMFNSPPIAVSPFRKFISETQIEKHSYSWNLAYSPSDISNIFYKERYSALTPKVLRQLEKDKVEEIALVGINTEVSIYLTAIELFNRNIRPMIISALTASKRGERAHAFGINTIQRSVGYGQVV